jgi:hypothetical protein
MLRPTLPHSRWHYNMSKPFTLRCPFSCPTFWERGGLVLPLIVGLFGGSLTRVGVCFCSNRHSFEYHANTSPFMCGFKGRRLVINSCYHISILFIIDPLFHSIMYLFWLATSYNVHLSRCQCGHTIDDLGTHLL